MSLLQDIINEAVSSQADVPRLLRLCLLLASRLKHEPLKVWARRELEGYPLDASLPQFRVLRGQHKGKFSNSGGSRVLEISLVVLPEELREHYRQVRCRESVAECADLVSKMENGRMMVPWPVELAVKYASKTVHNAQCTSAWTEVSPSEMVGLLDQIKTKVMAFALEIEEADPTAGEVQGAGVSVLKEEQVTQIFNTTISAGTVQNIAMGSTGAQQSAINGIQPGDVASLIGALISLGIEPDRIRKLELAIEEDRKADATGLGSKAKVWLADLALKSSQKAAETGAVSLVTMAAQALAIYFGISVT